MNLRDKVSLHRKINLRPRKGCPVIRSLLCLLVLGCLLAGCLGNTEDLTETPTGAETAVETADPSWRFESRFDAKQACLNALDLIHHIKHYDSEAMTDYQAYQKEVREILYNDETTQAQFEALYPQILEKASTLSLQRGDIARVYISTNNNIGNSYADCRMGFVPAIGEEGEESATENESPAENENTNEEE